MRVVFVNPVPPEGRKVYTGFSHGIGYLSAVAKRAGHETRLVTATRRDPGVIEDIAEFRPDVVALTATSAQWGLAAWVAGEISGRFPEIPIVAGGVHVTVAPEEAISTPGIWAICRGEGEEVFPEMLSALECGGWEETAGFWTRPQAVAGVGPTPVGGAGGSAQAVVGEVVRNRMAPLVDLTALPHPDRGIYDYQSILDRNRNNVGAEFMASRGCPFSCSYCVNPVMSELTSGGWSRVRYRPVEDVISETEDVLGRYNGVKMAGFHDDIFGLDKNWLAQFAAEYPRRIGLPFWCNERAGTFGQEDARTLKEAGCFRVHMGIESADDTLRRAVLGRDIRSEAIEDAFAMVKRAGMRTVAFNMIGVPCETEDTIKATIELNRRIRPDWLVVSVFSPFPGTRLGKLVREKGWGGTGALPESYYDEGWGLDQPSLARERLLYYYRNFVDLVYDKGPKRNAI